MNNKLTFSDKLFLINIICTSILVAFLSSRYTIPLARFITYIYIEVIASVCYPETKSIMYD
jgi:hypothetical protein